MIEIVDTVGQDFTYKMLKYLLFLQCAILSTLFERIECPSVDYPIRNFGMVDIYNKVYIEGDEKTGRFVFRKNEVIADDTPFFIPFSDIVRETLEIEQNKQVVQFSIKTGYHANFNIKFKYKSDAKRFVDENILPELWNLHWGRIYSNWMPARITSDNLDNDVGFKILDENDACLHEGPYLFKRSQMNNVIWSLPPDRVYMRNKSRAEDYFIHFVNEDHKNAFTDLFPNATYNGPEIADYYFMRR